MTRLSDEALQKKLHSFSQVDAESGCWNWMRAIVHGGYGQINTGGRGCKARAHRVAYEVFVGPIPAGLVIDHLCRNRRCCNPAHLEAVTHQVNILRGVGITAQEALRTQCPMAHPYSTDNTGYTSRGHRYCRICKRDQINRASRKRRAIIKAARVVTPNPFLPSSGEEHGR